MYKEESSLVEMLGEKPSLYHLQSLVGETFLLVLRTMQICG